MGKAEAVTATAGKIALLFYNTMRCGMPYANPGTSHDEQRYGQRAIADSRRRAMALVFTLQDHPTGGSREASGNQQLPVPVETVPAFCPTTAG